MENRYHLLLGSRLRCIVASLFAPVVLCLPLLGCGSEAPPEKSPEEIEKARQEHIKRAERELADG